MSRNRIILLGIITTLAASCAEDVTDARTDAASSASSASGSGGSGGDTSLTTPFTVAAGLLDPDVIVADASAIYWSNRGTNVDNEYPKHDGSLVKLAHTGGSPVVLVEGANIETLAADSDSLYWIDADTIRRVPKAGGSPGVVAVDADLPQWLTVDATDVYWTTAMGTIVKAAKQGGPATTLVPASALNYRKIAVDATDVYSVDYGEVTTPFTNGGIWKVAKSGGPMSNVVSGLNAPWAVSVDDASVYWSTVGDTNPSTAEPAGTIFKVAKGGGAPILLADDQQSVYDFAHADGALFWGNYTSGPVTKLDEQSGTPKVLAPSESAVSIALGPDLVYWVVPYEDDGGSIRAVAR